MNTRDVLSFVVAFLQFGVVGLAFAEHALQSGEEALGTRMIAETAPQDPKPVSTLPAAMTGWVKVIVPDSNFRPASNSWGIEIAERKPDESFSGTLRFNGRNCKFDDGVPMTGTYNGSVLSVEGRLGKCGKAIFTLAPGKDHLFEGTYNIGKVMGNVTDKQAILDPK